MMLNSYKAPCILGCSYWEIDCCTHVPLWSASNSASTVTLWSLMVSIFHFHVVLYFFTSLWSSFDRRIFEDFRILPPQSSFTVDLHLSYWLESVSCLRSLVNWSLVYSCWRGCFIFRGPKSLAPIKIQKNRSSLLIEKLFASSIYQSNDPLNCSLTIPLG